MLTFSCNCGKQLAAKEEHGGQETVCPECGKRLMIPRSAPTMIEPIDSSAPHSGVPSEAIRRSEDGGDWRDRDRPRRDRDDFDDQGRRRAEIDRRPTSAAAVASLICGILSLCPLLFLIPNLIAIITGIIGLVAAGQGKKGRGMAIAGLVLGSVSIVLLPLLMLPAIQKVRESAAQMSSANNLKQIAIAVHTYHDVNQKMPQAAIFSENGEPLLSWRVAILPFVEQQALFSQFRLNEPWDSPHNKSLLNSMPPMYAHPSQTADRKSMTHYQVFVAPKLQMPGPPFCLDKNFECRLQQMTDGTSNTILAVEAANAVPWTKPEDIPFPWPSAPAFGVTGSRFNVAMCDGSVTQKNRSVRPEILSVVVTMDDGQALPFDWGN